MKENSGQHAVRSFLRALSFTVILLRASVFGKFRQIRSLVMPLSRRHLIRQPFGLPPSPKGKALAGATTYNLAYQGAIPSCTQECYEYLPACARIDSGGTPPIPSCAQECYKYLPACARIDSGGTPPRIVRGDSPQKCPQPVGWGQVAYLTYSITTRRLGSTPVEWVVILSMSWRAA